MTKLIVSEASIDELQGALSSGALTSVDLVAHYLRRISRYDCRGVTLNSIPILNSHVFEEAAVSDDSRASGNPVRLLEGIPFTVKDSYKVKGQTAASGSPAFKDLVASDDAFTVAAIRTEGGVLIGRTNMPPVAHGGMQRGVYGRAESPYNPKYLAAAFASGSSNGSAVSTAASLAAFGMGEETVSSGRSPASNNALVAYTPSRGWISIRGNWPLYPTCDVVVPHTRTMDDMLALLEVITAEDASTVGDFWRGQPFIKLAEPWGGRHPKERGVFRKIAAATSLKGLRFAVPHMYVGGPSPDGALDVTVSDSVVKLWGAARRELEALGAEVIVVPDFPAVTAYENPDVFLPRGGDGPRLPDDWNWYERGPLVAHAWDQFLRVNGDPNCPDLASVNELNIFPISMRGPAEVKYVPQANTIHWGKLASYVKEGRSIYEVENLDAAVKTLEKLREVLVDDYLERHGCNCFVFPCQGDVGAADADVDDASAEYAWKNGVWYSNGNRALRHLGIPSVTVPMGVLEDKEMPMGLTFAGRAYDDERLLSWANAYAKETKMRSPPVHTPPLLPEVIDLTLAAPSGSKSPRPVLNIENCSASAAADGDPRDLIVYVRGTVAWSHCESPSAETGRATPVIDICVNGEDIGAEDIEIKSLENGGEKVMYQFEAKTKTLRAPEKVGWERTAVPVARDKTMVVVLARAAPCGRPTGFLGLI